MKQLIIGNWRTTLLAVSILIALLMFTQQKISPTEFLAILGFFNVAGFLLAKDARSAEHRSLIKELEEEEANYAKLRTKTQQRRYEMIEDITYRVVVAFIITVLLLCFYPLLRDAVSALPVRQYQGGNGYSTPYSTPYSPAPVVPGTVPAPPPASTGGASLPADDDEPPHGPPTGPFHPANPHQLQP
jgi:hypothetical protein